MADVCVIFPALNEEESIGKVIDEVPVAEMEKEGDRVQIVVVDNDSTDKTGEIAQSKGALVLMEDERGKGKAVRKAFASVSADFVFMLDSDYTYPATYIPQMLELLKNDYDVVLGSRLKGKMEKGAMRSLNLIGNHLLAFTANALYGTRISDLCTGCWGFRGEVIRTLRLDAIGFDLEANMFIEIAKQGYRIGEVPILYRKRKTPSKLNAFRAGYRIGRMLINKKLF
jgi:dolichol-phosphate mannosyltransferase